MMQHDHLGYPMFIHANLLKQIPSGVGRGFTWGRTRQTGLFNGGDPLVEGGEGSGDVEADREYSGGSPPRTREISSQQKVDLPSRCLACLQNSLTQQQMEPQCCQP